MDAKYWLLICTLAAIAFWALGQSADAAMDACMKAHSEATCAYSLR